MLRPCRIWLDGDFSRSTTPRPISRHGRALSSGRVPQ
jgi:hypothetical protein